MADGIAPNSVLSFLATHLRFSDLAVVPSSLDKRTWSRAVR